MRMVPATVDDFRGGLNTGAPLVGFPRNQFPDLVNADALVNGRLRRRNGTRRTHDTPLADGSVNTTASVGATVWWPSNVAQRVAIVQNSFHVSDDDGQTWSLISSSLALSNNSWHFATVRLGGSDWLYAANGGTNTYRWDGASTFEVAPGIPNNVQYMAVFNDRLYVAGHDGNNVAASEIGNAENFSVPDGLVLPVSQDTGAGGIRGLYEVGPILLVFGRDGTAYISGFGQSDLIVATGATGVSRSVGCLSAASVQSIGGNAAIWLSPRGFELFDGGRIQPISSPQLDKILDDEALRTIEAANNDGAAPVYASAIFLPRRQQYWCSIVDRVNEAALLKYDLRTKSWTVHRYEMRDERGATSSVVRLPLGKLVAAPAGDITAVLGTTQDSQQQAMRPEAFTWDCFYREIDWGDTDDADSDLSDGLGIEMEGRLKPFIWRDLPHRKRARQMRVNAETFQSDAVVRVSAVVDGKEQAGPDVLTNGGFEAGSLAPWSTVDGGGAWSVVQTNPRSGDWVLQYDSAGQSAIASASTTASGLSGTGTLETTAQKGSAINVLTPWPMTLPQPDGTIDTADLRWFAHTFSGPFTNEEVSIPDAADPGDTWEFLVWVRAEPGLFARAGVVYRDAGLNIVGSKFTALNVVEADGGYIPLRIAAVAPAGTVEVQGRIEALLAITAGARGWFDDARLRKLKRKAVTIPSTEDDIPRQPLRANVNGRGRTHQVGIYTTDRVEIVSVEERAEILREP